MKRGDDVHRLIWLLFSIALVACQASSGPTSGPATEVPSVAPAPAAAPATAPATPAPAASATLPAPTAAASIANAPLTGEQDICSLAYIGGECPLPPATYRPTFKPALRLVLTEEYIAQGAHDTGFGFRQDDHELTVISGAIQGFDPATAMRLDERDRKRMKLQPGAQGFVAYLREHPMLTVTAPTTAAIDGIPAIQVDVTSTATADMALFEGSVLGFDITPAEKLRVVVADVQGKPFLILFEAYHMADFDRLWPRAKAIIDSIMFIK